MSFDAPQKLGRIINKPLLNLNENLTVESCHIEGSPVFNREALAYTGRSLINNLQQYIDFVVVTEELFVYLQNQYGCDYPILRYGIRDVGRSGKTLSSCFIEFYLCKLFIIDVPKESEQNDYEIILISQNQKVRDLESRIAQSRDTTDFRLWKLVKPNEPFKDFYSSLRRQFKHTKKIIVQGERLDAEGRSIGSLRFTRDDLLTVEYMLRDRESYVFEAEQPEESMVEDTYDSAAMFPSRDRSSDMNEFKIDTLVSHDINAGICGLNNLNNTWYMNAALQCLSNTRELLEYFLNRNNRLEVNKDNALGTQGEVSREFEKVIHSLWNGRK